MNWKSFIEKLLGLTGQKLQHRWCHGNSGRDVSEFNNKSRQELDHDVRHLHRAHCKCHNTLFGTAVNEASLKALNQLSLQRSKEIQ